MNRKFNALFLVAILLMTVLFAAALGCAKEPINKDKRLAEFNKPSEELTPEQATEDGWVVLDGNRMLSNSRLMEQFYSDSIDKNDGLGPVLIYQRYSGDNTFYASRVYKDGDSFVHEAWDKDGQTSEDLLVKASYKHIKRELASINGKFILAYCLMDDPSATYEGWFKHIVKSDLREAEQRYKSFKVVYSVFIDEALYSDMMGPDFENAYVDVDADGRKELCYISHGPTSGVYSFRLRIYNEYEPIYDTVFIPMAYSGLTFETDEASGATYLVLGETRYTITVEGDTAVLIDDDGNRLEGQVF